MTIEPIVAGPTLVIDEASLGIGLSVVVSADDVEMGPLPPAPGSTACDPPPPPEQAASAATSADDATRRGYDGNFTSILPVRETP